MQATTTINGITVKGPESDIQRLRGQHEHDDYLDLVQEAMEFQPTFEHYQPRLKARAALAGFERDADNTLYEGMEDADADKTDKAIDQMLCKYAGRVYLLPKEKDKLVERLLVKFREAM